MVESIKLFLAISWVDIALTEDGPLIPTDTSYAEPKMKYDKWTHSNKTCLIAMKDVLGETFFFCVWQILDSLPFEFDMLRTSYNT